MITDHWRNSVNKSLIPGDTPLQNRLFSFGHNAGHSIPIRAVNDRWHAGIHTAAKDITALSGLSIENALRTRWSMAGISIRAACPVCQNAWRWLCCALAGARGSS